MRYLFITLAIILKLVTYGSESAAAEACQTPVDFYLITQDTLSAAYGFNGDRLVSQSVQEKNNALSTIADLNRRTNGTLSFCYHNFVTVRPIDVANFAPMKSYIDEIKQFQARMNIYVQNHDYDTSAVYQAQLSHEVTSQLRVMSEKFCHLLQLNAAELSDYFGRLVSGDGTIAELPERTLIINCGLNDLSLMEGGQSAVDAVKGGQFNLMDYFSTIVAKWVGSVVGRDITGSDVVPERKNEKPALRHRQIGVLINHLTPHDSTFMHETGHFLGLSHLGTTILGKDLDLEESGVTDTPTSVETVDDDIEGKPLSEWLKVDRKNWPKAKVAAKDENGQPISTMPLDNIMNWGLDDKTPSTFTPSQISVMKHMRDLMTNKPGQLPENPIPKGTAPLP